MRAKGGKSSFESEIRVRGRRRYEGSIPVLNRFLDLAYRALAEVVTEYYRSEEEFNFQEAIRLRLDSVRNTVGWLPSTTYLSLILYHGALMAIQRGEDEREVLTIIVRLKRIIEARLAELAERLSEACRTLAGQGDAVLLVSDHLGERCLKGVKAEVPVFEGKVWRIGYIIYKRTGRAVLYPESTAYSALKRYRKLIVEIDGIAGELAYVRAGAAAVLESAHKLGVNIAGLVHDLAVHPAEFEASWERLPHMVIYTEWGEPLSLPIYEAANLRLFSTITTGTGTFSGEEEYINLRLQAGQAAQQIIMAALGYQLGAEE